MGGSCEVVHDTQLLNRLVRDGWLTPVAPPSENGAGAGTAVTYHEPCYIGRHNGVYDPPRELIGALPGVTLTEMPRHGNLSFCCGAGGARMWTEEKLGTRINGNRTEEAAATGAPTRSPSPAFCRVMLSDALSPSRPPAPHPRASRSWTSRRCYWPPCGAKPRLTPPRHPLRAAAPEKS